MDFVVFLLLGICTGCFGTLVGLGGGIICVPIFIFFMSEGCVFPYFTTAAQITGTSLFVVLANAVSGSWAYMRQKRVYMPAAIPFAAATLPGAFLGACIVDKFTGSMLDFYFGIFLLCMSVIMTWNTLHEHRKDVLEILPGFRFNRKIGIAASFGAGFISSIFGVGGGAIHVPLMVYLLDFPVHIATATSSFILAISAAFGVVSHLWLEHIVWVPAICISIGAAVGAQIGAKISRRTKSKTILLLLALTMVLVGIRLIYQGNM